MMMLASLYIIRMNDVVFVGFRAENQKDIAELRC